MLNLKYVKIETMINLHEYRNSKVLTPDKECCKINMFRGIKTYIHC